MVMINTLLSSMNEKILSLLYENSECRWVPGGSDCNSFALPRFQANGNILEKPSRVCEVDVELAVMILVYVRNGRRFETR